ncbi:MAG: replication-associated recombination protein A [Bacteroidia bacterium]|nr:replication-associated recombination protein A [Bacteroidia bacterium]NNC85249.1 replication-associated recombination protein A [Bacteroidia bacterium]NNM15202.1 replication-associated recombination protein A [Bacteroidia bacterium]
MVQNAKPLAERMRPYSLKDYVGQTHLVGEGGVIRKMIENKKLSSIIFWGPPGTGKTTLANIISESLGFSFYSLSAVEAGVKDVRKIIEAASKLGNTILFIDEIHRFNKAQQDALLGAVEKGIVTLIGATTENPSFEVISPLLSRSQVFILNALNADELIALLKHALETDEVLMQRKVELKETDVLLQYSGGDARKLLNNLELTVNAVENDPVVITDDLVQELIQQRALRYDKTGEQHYDIISAFIKSMRGSDPNAALYYLARMIVSGEDPKFIARRMLIFSSEDIGNANPNAMVLANSCFQAINVIGYPECELILSQTAIYLATSVKSNASYEAISKAKANVRKTGNLEVPLEIRNPVTDLMKDLDYGKGYKYAHSYEGNFADEEFLPKEVIGSVFYEPGNNAKENEIRARLKHWWKNKYKY